MTAGRLLVIAGLVTLLVSFGAPARADETAHPWSVAPGAGLVDGDAIGTSPALSVELERIFPSGFSVGVRGLYARDDSDFETRDVLAADLFARLRWQLTTIRPFVEAGLGRYEFAYDTESGWFAGVGVDLPWAERRSVLFAARYHSVDRGFQDRNLDLLELHAAVRFRF